MNIILQRKINCLPKAHGSISENLTGCLHRYAVFGYERMIKHLNSNPNNIVWRTIFREQNFGFHQRD
jgi:hypothetical protein